MANKNQSQDEAPQKFQSDAQKLANKHLSDPDHIITDEELANVRIGMTPPPDAPTREAIRNADEKIADRKSDNDSDTAPGAQKTTPWDMINPWSFLANVNKMCLVTFR